MLQSARNSMRSWMFIYVGLFVAIVVAAHPVDTHEARLTPTDVRPITVETPISRTDF